MIIELPKNDSLTESGNWKDIFFFLFVIFKICNSLNNSRPNQRRLWFTSRYGASWFSCIDHINIVQIIIEQCVRSVSASPGYDRLRESFRQRRSHTMCRRRRSPKILVIIKATYKGVKRHVLHHGKVPDPFEVRIAYFHSLFFDKWYLFW